MNEDTHLNYIKQQAARASLFFSEKEGDILATMPPRFIPDALDSLQRQAARAAVNWACISAKSQRAVRRPPVFLKLDQYESVTKINTCYPVNNFYTTAEKQKLTLEGAGYEPPAHENYKPRTKIFTFTEKSRRNLLDKSRRLQREGLKLPYFVTLTYNDNFQDFADAKKHLNTFLMRFRRLGEVRYIWKMELQERGAIHFHLALWLPDEMYPPGWSGSKAKRWQYTVQRVSAAWNEISQPNNNNHLAYGTNVRDCYNWRMFTGYMSKYLSKDQQPERVDPATGEVIDLNTGRWWATSRNLDFSALKTAYMSVHDEATAKTMLHDLNRQTYESFIKRQVESIERTKKHYRGKKLNFKLNKIADRIKRQKRRFAINYIKIEADPFRPLQFDLHKSKTARTFENTYIFSSLSALKTYERQF